MKNNTLRKTKEWIEQATEYIERSNARPETNHYYKAPGFFLDQGRYMIRDLWELDDALQEAHRELHELHRKLDVAHAKGTAVASPSAKEKANADHK